MSSAHDFTVIPLKTNPSDEGCHQLFVKENASKITCTDKPSGRTLYVLNVPPYMTKESLQYAFSLAGKVAKIALQEKPSSKESAPIEEIAPNLFTFKVAYVVYEKPESLKTILTSKRIHPLQNGMILTGVDKWTKSFSEKMPDRHAMQQEIDRYMESYDEEIEEKKKQEKINDVNDDGWITVSKKNSGVFAQKESVVQKLEKKIEDDRSVKQLKNFYTFQIRESKKNDIISLRKKYDRDLQKMEQIKKTKRFKPC